MRRVWLWSCGSTGCTITDRQYQAWLSYAERGLGADCVIMGYFDCSFLLIYFLPLSDEISDNLLHYKSTIIAYAHCPEVEVNVEIRKANHGAYHHEQGWVGSGTGHHGVNNMNDHKYQPLGGETSV